jgi:putative ABC transport system permease protein
MRIALAEMRRRRGRWVSIVGAVAFIVFLVLVLAALADGLFIGTTGALTRGDSDALVYSIDGRRSLVRSELPASDLPKIAAVAGVADVGALGVLLTTATAAAAAEPFDAAVIGHIPGRAGEPTKLIDGRRPEAGEPGVVLADASLEAEGISLGDTLTIVGASQSLSVVGFVEDSRYLLAHSLWVPLETWEALRIEVRPETARLGAFVQAFPILVEEGADVERVAGEIDTVMGATETVTTDEAALSLPGVEQQESTFTAIIAASFVVVALVIALFFALVTLEKRGQLAILKAIGSSNVLLLQGVLVQALIATVAGYAVGFLLARLLGFVLPAAVPVSFLPATAASLFLATVAMGGVGAAFSFRRVIRIDPASALGGEA